MRAQTHTWENIEMLSIFLISKNSYVFALILRKRKPLSWNYLHLTFLCFFDVLLFVEFDIFKPKCLIQIEHLNITKRKKNKEPVPNASTASLWRVGCLTRCPWRPVGNASVREASALHALGQLGIRPTPLFSQRIDRCQRRLKGRVRRNREGCVSGIWT